MSASELTEVVVIVEPQRPNTVDDLAAPIEHVVLKSKKDSTRVAQAVAIDMEPMSWQNLFGAEFTANRAIPRFATDDVTSLPDGEIDVVVVTGAGERRCKIGAKDRTRLFGSKSP